MEANGNPGRMQEYTYKHVPRNIAMYIQ